jgi:hypothetical protein
MLFRRFLVATAFAAALTPSIGKAYAESIRIGVLHCHVDSGLGLIVMSKKDMECVFTPGQGAPEHYIGTIRRFGIAIGETDHGELEWGVFAPAATRKRGALAGEYIGGGGSVTVGVGLGANVLVGGSGRSIALQPVSLQEQTGLDLSGGVTAMHLRVAH